jgi:hypothetical protein
LNPTDAAAVEAIGIKDHAVMDIHLGSGGGIGMALKVFATYPNYTMGAVRAPWCLETRHNSARCTCNYLVARFC